MPVRKRVPAVVGVALLMLAGPGTTGAASVAPDPVSAESARRGAAYLADQQGADGSVPDGWRIDMVGEAVVALVAGGDQEGTVEGALDYIADGAEDFLSDNGTNGARVARVVSGLVSAGEDPRDFAGFDWVAELDSKYVIGGGVYDDTVYGEALGMLGRLAAGEGLRANDEQRLRASQCDGGGWAWQPGCAGTPETDTTSLALSVLAEVAGPEDPDVQEARQWLLDIQRSDDDGGHCWGRAEGKFDNANSCGLALSAVVALNEDPGAAPWAGADGSPLGALHDLQLESGGFKWRERDTTADEYATIQAVPGMAHWSYPVSAPEPEPDLEPDPEPDPEPGGGDGPESDDGDDTDDRDDRERTHRTTSTVTRHQGRDEVAASRGDGQSENRPVPQVDRSPYDTTTSRLTTTSLGEVGAEGSPSTSATRRPPPGVAGATFGEDGDGVGAVPAGVAGGSLGSVALGVGWYWRRRALTASLTPWGDA